MPETSQNQQPINQEIQPLRPWGLAFFTVLTSFFSLWKLLQVIQTVLNWQILNQILPEYAPIYLAADGLLWAAVAINLSIAVWKGSSWSRLAAQIFSLIWALQQWIELILAPDPLFLQTRWKSNLLLSVVGVLLVMVLFNHPASRNFFKRKLSVSKVENL